MTLQLLRCTAQYVTIWLVGAYPTFSPLPDLETGGNFLLHYFTFTDDFPLKSKMLCVARTFLFCLMASAIDWLTAFQLTKVQINLLSNELFAKIIIIVLQSL